MQTKLPKPTASFLTSLESSNNLTEIHRAIEVFKGREEEILLLQQTLSILEPSPVVAISGMAGVGKSWLADHFYACYQTQFPGGYLRLTLDAENPVSADTLLAELGERCELSVSQNTLAQHLTLRLISPRTLVHIENIDSQAAVMSAIQLCNKLPGCPIVLSGRIESFGLNQRWQQVSLKPFQLADGLAQLQAELNWLGGTLPSDNDAKQLVNTLGGLPLAIHLAAGYLAQGYSATEFLEELQLTDYDLLPADASDDLLNRDAAKAVLHSTFRLSLNELAKQAARRKIDAADQRFANLGIASISGFGESIAETLLELPSSHCGSLLRTAQSLSLLDFIQTKPSRWQCHPLLSAYLRDQIQDDETVTERLNQWFLTRLPEPTQNQLESGDQHGWHELNNESLALAEWLSGLPCELQYQIERAGSQYATRNGPFIHWLLFCEAALNNPAHNDKQRSNILFTLMQVAQSSGNLDKAIAYAEEKYQLDVQREDGREAAIARGKIADILQARGNLDEALRIRQHEELPVYEQLGEVRSIAITKGQIADILQARGNLDEALRIRQHEELPVYEQLGDVREIAITKGQIADILQARGNLDEALRIRKEDQLPVYEQLGDVRSIAITKGQIADILQARGNLDEALRIRKEDQLPVYEQLGEVRSIAITKGQIADILQARGNLDEALRIRKEDQLPVYEQLGEVRSIAITKGKIADILQARGNLDEALRIRKEDQLPVYEQLGDVRSIAITKGQIADILQARGNLDEALRIRQEDQLPVYEQLGEVRSIAITKGKIADILQARGNLDEALRIRQHEELPVYEQLSEVRSIAITKGKIADILQARGSLDEALRIRQHDVLLVYQQLGDVREIAITKGKIADILQARGNLDEALRIRKEDQLPVYEQLGEVRSIAITKGQIADILQTRGNLDEALRIRQEDQLPVYEQLGEVRSIAITKGQIADIMFLNNKHSEAFQIYEKSVLPVYEMLGDKRMLLVDQTNLAIQYLQTNQNHERAVELLLAAYQSAQEMQIPEAEQIKGILEQIGHSF